MSEHVKFISYDGKFPCLCGGTLVLEIDGALYTFGLGEQYDSFWASGGGLDDDYCPYYGAWVIYADELPESIRQYAGEIEAVFNENVPQGCCGGCS